jgi:hypothetical protein
MSESNTSPPERASASAPVHAGSQPTEDQEEPKHRHRGIVWTLVVLASVVLLVSMIANWVQTEVLDSGEFSTNTEEILGNEDVQEQLSIFAVDQLYANVDVQGQIEQTLPPPAQPFAGPVTAATRQLATNVAETALASPQVQQLMAGAINGAQQRFVSLIEDEGQFVSTEGGVVTLEYGNLIADLAARLGLDANTISEIQGFVQEFSGDLRQRLTAAQSNIESTRSALSAAEAGTLSSEAQTDLKTLKSSAAELQGIVGNLEQKIRAIKPKVPDQLKGRMSDVQVRLAEFDRRLTALQRQIDAVLSDPSQANVIKLDPALASLQARITTVLNRQAVQNPGQLVLMSSSELSGLQDLVSALRNLGFVLPLLALFLYLAAIYLAKGWRREALIGAGGGILAAALIVLLTRRLLGGAIESSTATSDTVKPAISAVWDIISAGLRERALFVSLIGLAFIGGGLVAGPGRREVAVRRLLAPYLRDHPVVVYAVLAFLFLIWLAFLPTINNFGQVLVVVILAALAIAGVEILRRQTAREFPTGSVASGQTHRS